MRRILKVLAGLVIVFVMCVSAEIFSVWLQNATNPYVKVSIVWPWTKQPIPVDIAELDRAISEAEPGSRIFVYPDGTIKNDLLPVSEWKDVLDMDCTCGNRIHIEPYDAKHYKFECIKCGRVYEKGWGVWFIESEEDYLRALGIHGQQR